MGEAKRGGGAERGEGGLAVPRLTFFCDADLPLRARWRSCCIARVPRDLTVVRVMLVYGGWRALGVWSR